MFNRDKLLNEINKKGWSRYRLSKESGVAQTTLRDIFGGKQVTPSTRTLERIATSLEVPISSFFDEEIEFLNTNLDADAISAGHCKLNTQLSEKTEKDLKKSLIEILDLLKNSQDNLMFDGKPLNNLTRELLAQCFEHSIIIAEKTVKK